MKRTYTSLRAACKKLAAKPAAGLLLVTSLSVGISHEMDRRLFNHTIERVEPKILMTDLQVWDLKERLAKLEAKTGNTVPVPPALTQTEIETVLNGAGTPPAAGHTPEFDSEFATRWWAAAEGSDKALSAVEAFRGLVSWSESSLPAGRAEIMASHFYYADALKDADRYAEAAKEFRTTMRLAAGVTGLPAADIQAMQAECREELAPVLLTLGNYQEAEAEYRTMREHSKKDSSASALACLGIAQSLDGQGRDQDAESAYEEAIQAAESIQGVSTYEIHGAIQEAHDAFAVFLASRSRHKEAEASLRAGIKKLPGDGFHTHSLFLSLSAALLEQAQFAEAKSLAQRVRDTFSMPGEPVGHDAERLLNEIDRRTAASLVP